MGSSQSNGTDTIRYVISLKYVGPSVSFFFRFSPFSFTIILSLFLSTSFSSKSLPSHEDVSIRILVSLPPSYPAESPPQLQLLSRYIGAFGVDASLFGSILRTFISASGVEWSPDTVCVFDGLQSVLERSEAWYEDKLNKEKIGEVIREDTLGRDSALQESAELMKEDGEELGRVSLPTPILQDVALPEGIELIVAEPIVDRKSVFIGRACQISHPSQVRRARCGGSYRVLIELGGAGSADIEPLDVRSTHFPRGTSDHQCLALSSRKCTPPRWVTSSQLA